LSLLLEFLPTLNFDDAARRAKVLWDALADLEARGTGAFYGTYRWGYFHESRNARFDAFFVRELNLATWVPARDGELVAPGLVLFDDLCWKANPFLQSKILFKPPIIDQLAREAGIDPAAIDLLRKLGITNVAELTSRLGIVDSSSESALATSPKSGDGTSSGGDVYDQAKDLYGGEMPDIPPGTPDPDGGDDVAVGAGGASGKGNLRGNGESNGGGGTGNGSRGATGGKNSGNSGANSKRTAGQAGERPFISYVGAHPSDDEPDPDGLDQDKRMQIEALAIELILTIEPTLRRTPEGNPGFDLYEDDRNGNQTRWVEVKSMTGTLMDRSVGLSRTQFDCALEKGDAYWLYIVENAVDLDKARILRIQNPARNARTFTFDRGWSAVALTDPPG
jgi:hypothetical protein